MYVLPLLYDTWPLNVLPLLYDTWPLLVNYTVFQRNTSSSVTIKTSFMTRDYHDIILAHLRGISWQ